MADRMRTLREWYRYLDQQARLVARLYGPAGNPPASDHTPPAKPPAPRPVQEDIRRPSPPEAMLRSARRRVSAPPEAPAPGPGRPRLDRDRRRVLHRLLDPEVALHDAALLLNVSKSTLRRYTDSGRLSSYRSPGGQRRFRLSELLSFIETTEHGAPPARRRARRTARRRRR